MNIYPNRRRQVELPGDEHLLARLLQRQALEYFIDNQLPSGLVLDRQHNHGRRSFTGLCSMSATGMGLIALALAARPHHALITVARARKRVAAALRTAIALQDEHGMLPHFIDRSLQAVGSDRASTVDSAWFFAGALWCAQELADKQVSKLANRLWRRVDWRYFLRVDNKGEPLLSHGLDDKGQFLPNAWDRFNAETAFMYLLSIGAALPQSMPPQSWFALSPESGLLAGKQVVSADLGLFVYQYSLTMLDGHGLPPVQGLSLGAACLQAMRAHRRACRLLGSSYSSYRRFWGISAGDGPASARLSQANPTSVLIDGGEYRAYAPAGPVDGTVHLTATLACLPSMEKPVLANLKSALADSLAQAAFGRYGFSNFNHDRLWISRDVVGIDIGVAALALENYLHGDAVRRSFQSMPVIRCAFKRLSAAAR